MLPKTAPQRLFASARRIAHASYPSISHIIKFQLPSQVLHIRDQNLLSIFIKIRSYYYIMMKFFPPCPSRLHRDRHIRHGFAFRTENRSWHSEPSATTINRSVLAVFRVLVSYFSCFCKLLFPFSTTSRHFGQSPSKTVRCRFTKKPVRFSAVMSAPSS